MKIFDKFFRDSTNQPEPSNYRLNQLLNIYVKENGKGDSYKNVVMELMNGNSFLVLSTKNQSSSDIRWSTAIADITTNLTCIFDQDGLKVLGAFTDESLLIQWANGLPTPYIKIPSNEVLIFCQENGINRIVINSNSQSMLVIERSKENVKQHQINMDTEVQIGRPIQPLSNIVMDKLVDQFKTVSSILEVYQYGQTKDGEYSIVLGIRLETYSHNAKTAAINSIQNALQDQTINQHLDVFFIETDGWYDKIKNIPDSFLYKK